MATQTAVYTGQFSKAARTSRSRPPQATQRMFAAEQARRDADAAERRRERDELTLKLMGLVRRVALEMRDHLPAHVDVDDLVSAGTIGLMDAVRRFEADKRVKIETYARYRIRGAILDALRGLDPASRDMRRKNKRAERVFYELSSKLGRPATDAEMAEAMHLSLKKWYEMVNELSSMGVEWLRPTLMPTLNFPAPEELPAINQQDQFELCYRQEQRDLLNQALRRISERERMVLSLYYEHNLTMEQIARQLGIDESRVSQIHSATVKRLRSKVRTMVSPSLTSSAAAA